MSVTAAHTAHWGVSVHQGAVAGVVTSYDRSDDPLFQAETDIYGSVCRQKLYDVRTRSTFTVQVAAYVEPPKSGVQITVNGHSGYVVNAVVVESNRAFRKIRVTIESYLKCTTADVSHT